MRVQCLNVSVIRNQNLVVVFVNFSYKLTLNLNIRLSVQSRGKGHVVEGSWDCSLSFEGLHSLDAILSLVWRKFPSQFVRKDVWLRKRIEPLRSSSQLLISPVRKDYLKQLTLSAARILKESMTCSAVSTSVDSRVMKSRKASKCTYPLLLASTAARILWKSMSP